MKLSKLKKELSFITEDTEIYLSCDLEGNFYDELVSINYLTESKDGQFYNLDEDVKGKKVLVFGFRKKL